MKYQGYEAVIGYDEEDYLFFGRVMTTASIYHIPIQTTAGLAHHYFISSDGTFDNSIGWGPKGIEYKG